MTESVQKIEHGAIVYDSSIFNQVSEDLFQPRCWQNVVPVNGVLRSSGRGNTLIVSNGIRDFVLRKFVRGGLIGRIIRDTYFWNGEDQTRSFMEWRLLDRLVDKGFNVPVPAAAMYRRTAMFYTADLLTVRIPGIQSLAARLLASPAPASRTMAVIRQAEAEQRPRSKSAIVHARRSAIDIYESLAYTGPGIVAHNSAMKEGELLKIPQYNES